MKFESMPIDEYLERLGSKEPVPGGGGTCALAAALGVALGRMVGSFTAGKKKYADVENEILVLMQKCDVLSQKLRADIDRDAEVFAPLSKAYSLPKETEEERKTKDEVMEKCLRDAVSVPLALLDECAEAVGLLEAFAEKGSKLALSDAGVGAALVRAAMEGAALNVFINTKYMKDRAYADEKNAYAARLLAIYPERAQKIYDDVKERLKNEWQKY